VSIPFQRTQRVYMTDGFQGSYCIMFGVILLLIAWVCFFFLSSVAVDENFMADRTPPVTSTDMTQAVKVKISPASLLLQSLGR
jgi:hypothetical protein